MEASMDNENNQEEQERFNTENDSTPKETSEENQSLEDSQSEKNSIDPNDDSIEKWVKGISESDEVENEKTIADIEHLEVKKGDLPDWINTLSESGKEAFDGEEDFKESQESIEAIKFTSLDDAWGTEPSREEDHIQDQEAPSAGNVESNEGFVEISSYEINQDETPGDEPSSFQNFAEEEELPDWLEEMITEQTVLTQEEAQIPFDEKTSLGDESTKPVTIDNEEIVDEELTDMEFFEEEFSDEEFVDIEFSDEEHLPGEDHFKESYLTEIDMDQVIQAEKFEDALGEDHFMEEGQEEDLENVEEVFSIEEPGKDQVSIQERPTSLLPEDIDAEVQENIQHDDWESANSHPVEIPKTLRFGKYLLDQGEIDPAFEIFQTYVKKPEHLENIKAWVSEAIREEENPSSLLWELLGDIEYKQNEHNKALSAYTRAISMLISQPKG
jgi:hypothetical protein